MLRSAIEVPNKPMDFHQGKCFLCGRSPDDLGNMIDRSKVERMKERIDRYRSLLIDEESYDQLIAIYDSNLRGHWVKDRDTVLQLLTKALGDIDSDPHRMMAFLNPYTGRHSPAYLCQNGIFYENEGFITELLAAFTRMNGALPDSIEGLIAFYQQDLEEIIHLNVSYLPMPDWYILADLYLTPYKECGIRLQETTCLPAREEINALIYKEIDELERAVSPYAFLLDVHRIRISISETEKVEYGVCGHCMNILSSIQGAQSWEFIGKN